jgi:hypothetical protein
MTDVMIVNLKKAIVDQQRTGRAYASAGGPDAGPITAAYFAAEDAYHNARQELASFLGCEIGDGPEWAIVGPIRAAEKARWIR